MAQWTNVNRNNRFINLPPLPWMSEVSGTIHLALPGLMAGKQAGWLTCGLNPMSNEILKVDFRSTYSSFHCV